MSETHKDPFKCEIKLDHSEEFQGLHEVRVLNMRTYATHFDWIGEDLEHGITEAGKVVMVVQRAWEMRRQLLLADEREQQRPSVVEESVELGEETDLHEVFM